MIAAIAERQHGVASRRQLVAAGVSDDAIAYRVAIRRLHRIHPGVVGVRDPPGQLGLFMAATLACRAHLSQRSAAALWGLRAQTSGAVDVTRGRGGCHPIDGVRIRRTRALDPDETTICDGIPCTTVARTLVDLAGVLHEHDLQRVVERSIALRRFDGRALGESLARANGRRGVGVLRRLLAQLDDDLPPTRSELERRFLDLVREAGLPLPITNATVGGWEVDFHWPDARLIVETDGRATHDNPFAFERDRRRDLDLSLAGWTVIRITWRQLRDAPGRVVALLRQRLAVAG